MYECVCMCVYVCVRTYEIELHMSRGGDDVAETYPRPMLRIRHTTHEKRLMIMCN